MDTRAVLEHFKSIIARIGPDFIDNTPYDDTICIGNGITLEAGVSKCAIVDKDYDYIVKFDTTDCGFCDKEADNYASARTYGIEDMFAECEFLDDIDVDGRCIALYGYRKAKMTYRGYKVNEEEEKELTPYAHSPLRDRSDCVALDLLHDWGTEKFEKLDWFCEEMGINDLHNGNVGYIDGRLVLIDYSGWDDDEDYDYSPEEEEY